MWSLILLLGVCSPHWTTGELITRNSLIIHITGKDGKAQSLVSVNSSHNPEYENAINVSALGLDKIENGAFSELKGLESLNLEYNRLKELDWSTFSNLPNLTEISVAHNHITKLYGSLVGSPNLKYLNLSDNNITDLEESFFEALPNSVEIIMGRSRLEQNLWHNAGELSEKLRQIHPWFQYLVMGQKYKRNMLRKQPNSLGRGEESIFVKLCKTDDGTVESVKVMAEEELHENCRNINASQDISVVQLNHYGLKNFERGWFQVSDIFTTVDLSGNNITKITPELLNDLPPFIEVIRLRSTNTTTIEKNIIDNKFLKAIELDSNPLVIIEAGAFEKTNLHSLHFPDCSLSSIEFVRTLPKTLKYLNLDDNQISEIPKNCLANLQALEVLELGNNQLTRLPLETFQGLKELRYLNLWANRLQKIEAGILDDNKKLQIFAAPGNSIVELEDRVFENTKELKSISLEDNKITKISSNTFSGLRNESISRISLHSNQIDTIERGSFTNMSIDHLDLSNNLLTEKSVAKGAFEFCKLGEVIPDLHTIGVEYTSLVQHQHFYGLELHYEKKGFYIAHGKRLAFFLTISD